MELHHPTPDVCQAVTYATQGARVGLGSSQERHAFTKSGSTRYISRPVAAQCVLVTSDTPSECHARNQRCVVLYGTDNAFATWRDVRRKFPENEPAVRSDACQVRAQTKTYVGPRKYSSAVASTVRDPSNSAPAIAGRASPWEHFFSHRSRCFLSASANPSRASNESFVSRLP